MTLQHSGVGATSAANHLDHYESDSKKDDIPHYTVAVNFCHPHKSDGTEVKRQAVLSNLHDIRDHLQLLRMNNWSTNEMESMFDHLLLPLIVKTEHQRNPNNQTVVALEGFEDILDFLDDPKTTLITNIPGQNHFVAVDIRNQDNKASVLVLDSVHAGYYQKASLKAITHNMPPDAKTSIICMETQNSNFGCRIFALSAASKIAKSEDYMNALHSANFSSQSESLGELLQSHKVQSRYGADVYKHPGSIPASFLKHAQSRQRLTRDYPQQKEQEVNKKGQTLVERQEDKLVRREQLKWSDEADWILSGRTFSASIEDKRLEYLEHCIDYMHTADAETVEQMNKVFDVVKEESAMPYQIGPQLDQRPQGPHRVMQIRADDLNEYMLFETAPSSPIAKHSDDE